MAEKKLSEELRHCLEDDVCGDCQYRKPETKFTCRVLLQKAYEVVKRYEGMYEIMRPLAERLNEYTVLEEQGKLLKLPVAVEDMVYHLCAFSSGESEIIEMKVCCVEPCGAIRNHKGVCEVWNVYAETDYTKGYFKFFDFGKTVFLTRTDAERALAEMEGKNGN